jgi:ABC-type transport system involved in multi-copper enzyme maturation permease subunit
VSISVLLRHHVRRHLVPLVPLAVGLALFEWVMTFVAREPSVSRFLTTALSAAPPEFLALLNPDLVASVSAQGIIGVGYTHPFALLMLGFWSVRVPCAALAGEIGRGTMDLMAARPVPRAAHVAAALLALLAGLAILAFAAWAGTLLGLLFRPLPGVAVLRYLPVAGVLWLTFAAWGCVGLLVSALARDGGSAVAWTSGLMAGSYVLDYAARVWPRIASLRPLSLFSYYEPQQVLRVGVSPVDVQVLAGVGALVLAGAFAVFMQRDL